MNDEFQSYSGHQVIDRHGTEVGTITDVVYDEITEEPTWGVVSPGVLHARHYIPLAPPVYLDTGGAVVVPYDKTFVKHAPKANKDHVLTSAMKAELNTYYGIS